MDIYSAGIYARLSVHGDKRKNESIDTQIEIAKEYLKRQNNMFLYDCYTDLGKSGTDFKREGFERMMRDVRMHKINCVIVKDLSRFGRNHIETGNYIEKIFPFLGVRFISVTDNFDTLNISGKNEQTGINLKNLVNEMYARDIGIKVKSGKTAKWEQGGYIGGIPPYGYKSEWINDKKQLLIEDKSAYIVKNIYRLFLSGKNMKEIVLWLYEEEILRPTEYRRTGHVKRQKDDELQEWQKGTVKHILTNPVYTGCLIRNGEKKYTHEAVIDEKDFLQVSKRFEKTYKNTGSFNVQKEDDIFEDLVFCGECGSKMRRVSYSKKRRFYGYVCPNSDRIDNLKCKKKYISLKTLTDILKICLSREIFLSGMNLNDMEEINKQQSDIIKENLKMQLESIEKKIKWLKIKGSELYKDYRMGLIDLVVLEKKKREIQEKLYVLQKMQSEISEKLISSDSDSFICNLFKCSDNIIFTKDAVKAFVNKIEIYPDKRIKIVFAFKNKRVLYG